MYGYIEGITDTDEINYCPKCGENISSYYGDGTARCVSCDMRFGVIECEDEREEYRSE